jgi:hypothetical protein
MFAENLFDKTADLNRDICRNIVSLRKSIDLFDDLTDGDEELSAVAIEAEMRVKKSLEYTPPGTIYRGFHYSTAIVYPFEREPFMATRYGDGTYGVWYGSLEFETTLYETAYHMFRTELAVEGIQEIIIRERAVYDVNCFAILIDLRGKKKRFSQLVSDDYEFTHQIGRRLHREGHPGVLVPSARCRGVNAAIFNPSVLNNPRVRCYLTYYFDPLKLTIEVERQPSEIIMSIDGKRWF